MEQYTQYIGKTFREYTADEKVCLRQSCEKYNVEKRENRR